MHRDVGSDPIVRLNGVVRRFGAQAAVDGVTLDIEEGEFFSLLGPSGSGKTTLLRIIAGFERPDEGILEIAGADMRGIPPERRPVNTVFQSYALFPTMSVFENVAYGLRVRRMRAPERHERASAALALVQMEEFRDRRIGNLSGGQAQRVALARALVLEPRVLLLDEPLGALDLKLRQAMQSELKDLQRTLGLTFIYVTHDQEEALTMSDRLGVMNSGRLDQVGRPADVYRRPTTPFVAGFLGDANLLRVTRGSNGRLALGAIAGAAPTSAVEGDLCSLRPEAIRLGPAADACEVVISGTIEDVVFLGPLIRYRVRLEGEDATLTVIAPAGREAPESTSVMSVGWYMADVVPLARSQP